MPTNDKISLLQARISAHERLYKRLQTLFNLERLNLVSIAMAGSRGINDVVDIISFKHDDQVPPEFKVFLNDYATRLCAEMLQLREKLDLEQKKFLQ